MPLPPLAEQKRIVAMVEKLLARVNAAWERLAKVPAILKRFRQSVLAAACAGRLTADWRDAHPDIEPASDLVAETRRYRERRYEEECRRAKAAGRRKPKPPLLAYDDWEPDREIEDVPDAWSVVPVRYVADRTQYGTPAKCDGTDADAPVLRMGNIQEGSLDLTELKYLRPDREAVDSFLLRDGDVLFNRTNSPELVGKAAVYRGTEPMAFASYLIRVTPAPGCIPELLCYWINSPWGRLWARRVRTDGVSQSNINAEKLGNMPWPMPPTAEQHEIVRRVEALFKLADTIEQRVTAGRQRADKLTQAVLAKAFRGELVPTEAELARREGRSYEPASVLLQRIKADRDDAAKKLKHKRRKTPPRGRTGKRS